MYCGFIFQGRNEASYVFDPQFSLIITIPGQGPGAFYVMTGGGLYVPFSDDEDTTSPTFNLGVGWVRPLNETTLYYEIDPTLLSEAETVSVTLPLRIGVIF